MMNMSCKINYYNEQEKESSGNALLLILMSLSFFIVFLFAVSLFWPEGREVMRLMCIPGTPEETIDALETFISELDCGISITGAASDFLQKLIR